MILLADPHPFIVQETVCSSDAQMRAKSQTSPPLRAQTQTNLPNSFLMGAGRNFSTTSIARLANGIV
jgi:hypothetical protein